MFSNFDLLLHEDFLHSPSSSKLNTRPYSTNEPNKSTEPNTIQEGSFHCNAVANHASRLLSTTSNTSDLIIHSERSPSVALAWSYAFTLVFLNKALTINVKAQLMERDAIYVR